MLFAVTLFSSSPYLVYYSAEAKPYAGDVVAAIVLTLGTMEALHRRTPRSTMRLCAAGVLAVWFSQPAVVIVACITTTLLASRMVGDPIPMLGRMVAVWAAAILAAILVSLHSLGPDGMEYMKDFWNDAFLPFPILSSADASAYVRAARQFFRHPLSLVDPMAGLLATIAAIILVRRERRAELATLLAPVAAVVTASALHLFPFSPALGWPLSGRLLLFLAPGMILVMASGGAAMLHARLRPLRAAGALLLVWLVAQTIAAAALNLPEPRGTGRAARSPYDFIYRREDLRPAIARLAAGTRPGDAVYAHYLARPLLIYYGQDYGFDHQSIIRGRRFDTLEEFREEMAPLQGRGRVWLVFSRVTERRADQLATELDQIGVRLSAHLGHQTALFLYDLRNRGTR